MAITAADARTVDELLGVIGDGGQPGNLLFWGHQPPAGGVGKGCLSQWWPASFTVDGVSCPSAEHYMMAARARLPAGLSPGPLPCQGNRRPRRSCPEQKGVTRS